MSTAANWTPEDDDELLIVTRLYQAVDNAGTVDVDGILRRGGRAGSTSEPPPYRGLVTTAHVGASLTPGAVTRVPTRLLTARELAGRLRVHPWVVRARRRRGAFASIAVNVGTPQRPTWRYDEGLLERWIDEHRAVVPAQDSAVTGRR